MSALEKFDCLECANKRQSGLEIARLKVAVREVRQWGSVVRVFPKKAFNSTYRVGHQID